MISRYLQLRPGMTLIEAVIAIGIFSAIMLGATLLFAALWRMQGYSMQLGTASQHAAQALTRVTDTLRNARQADNGAYPVTAIASDSITIFSDADDDAGTEQVRFWRDGDALLMGVVQPTATVPVTYPADQESVTIIAADIVDNPDATPLFVYYDATNAALATPTADVVRMVRVAIAVDTTPDTPPAAVAVTSFASLRNLREW